jgi:hypothetical protein
MIKYLRKTNVSLIENLVLETVRTQNYQIKTDQSDQDDYIERKFEQINQNLYDISLKQLTNPTNTIIIYSNYRKLFNRTLIRIYKEQVCLFVDNIYFYSNR